MDDKTRHQLDVIKWMFRNDYVYIGMDTFHEADEYTEEKGLKMLEQMRQDAAKKENKVHCIKCGQMMTARYRDVNICDECYDKAEARPRTAEDEAFEKLTSGDRLDPSVFYKEKP